MELLTVTKDQIFDIFNSELKKEALPEATRNYIARLMADKVNSTVEINEEKEMIGAQIRNASGKELFPSLATIADSLLFLCGFFPEYFVNLNNKRVVSLDYYLGQGKLAYKMLGRDYKTHNIKPLSNLMFDISGNFIPYVNSMFNMRKSLDGIKWPSDENVLEKIYRGTRNKAILRVHNLRHTFLLDVFNQFPAGKYSQ